MLPRVQTTTLSQPPPWLVVAETSVTPAGRTSLAMTLLAAEGPLFFTDSVYVTF